MAGGGEGVSEAEKRERRENKWTKRGAKSEPVRRQKTKSKRRDSVANMTELYWKGKPCPGAGEG